MVNFNLPHLLNNCFGNFQLPRPTNYQTYCSFFSNRVLKYTFKQSDILYGYTKSNKHYRFGSHRRFSSYIPVLVMKDNTKIELENLSFKFETPAENFVNDIKMNKKVKRTSPNIFIQIIRDAI